MVLLQHTLPVITTMPLRQLMQFGTAMNCMLGFEKVLNIPVKHILLKVTSSKKMVTSEKEAFKA